MKKNITFDKKIKFPTMIGEVCSISLEHDLKFIDEENISGNLLLSGTYKLTEASRIEEEFNYEIPTDVVLVEKIDLNTSNIEISDFYYEIENDDELICHVELLVEGDEILDTVIDSENRECDSDIEKEIEIPIMEEKEEVKEEVVEEKKEEDERESLFINLDDDNDTYGTFIVYILRQNESINSIIEKYNTTLEEIEKYNDINNLNIGTKLIIPLIND